MASRRKKTTREHRIEFFGPLTIRNILDWLVSLWLFACIGFTMFQIGATRPETQMLCLYLIGLMALPLAGLLLAQALKSPSSADRFNPSVWLFVPWFCWLLLDYLFSPSGALGPQTQTAFWLMAGLCGYAAMASARERTPITLMLSLLAALAAIGSIQALQHYYMDKAGLPPIISVLEPGLHRFQLEDVYLGTAAAFLAVPQLLASFMLLVVGPAALGCFSRSLSAGIRLCCGYLWVMAAFCILLSMHYPSMLALVLILLFVPPLGRFRKLATTFWYGFVLALAAVVLWGLPAVDEDHARALESNTSGAEQLQRSYSAKAASKMIAGAPVFGVDSVPGHVAFEAVRPEAIQEDLQRVRNSFLRLGVDHGVPGLLLLMLPLLWTLLRAIRQWLALQKQPQTSTSGRRRRSRYASQPLPTLALACLILLWMGYLLSLWDGLTHESLGLTIVVFVTIGYYYGYWPLAWQAPWLPKLARFWPVAVVLTGLSLPIFFTRPYIAATRADEGLRQLRQVEGQLYDPSLNPLLLEAALQLLNQAAETGYADSHLHASMGRAQLLQGFLAPARREMIGQEAALAFARAQELSTEHVDALIGTALTQWMQGDAASATRLLEEATQLAPNTYRTWYYYAGVLNAQGDRPEAAIRAIERALRLRPDHEALVTMKRKVHIQ
jgi:hypothetical protein